MGISEDQKRVIRDGDFQLIADLYGERHALLGDFKTVTREYVRQVVNELRPANPGTAAEEIMQIAIKYLEHKRNFIDELLTT